MWGVIVLAAAAWDAAELARAIAVRTGEDIRNRLTAAFNLNPDQTELVTRLSNMNANLPIIAADVDTTAAKLTLTAAFAAETFQALRNIRTRIEAIEAALESAK